MAAPLYGLDEWWKLFTPRQLVAITTFCELLTEVFTSVHKSAVAEHRTSRNMCLSDRETWATEYAGAVVTYLAFTIDKCADYWSSISSWSASREAIRNTFSRQAIPIVWDFVECNPFSSSSGNWSAMTKWVVKVLNGMPANHVAGQVKLTDARSINIGSNPSLIFSTDPPYYDNVPYADISDFFYVWLRRNLQKIWPNELTKLSTPKAQELVASTTRAGSKASARRHFESGVAKFMTLLPQLHRLDVPATIFYAYKATETRSGKVRSTGWDTFLQAVVDAGLVVTATWPMRTELGNRLRAIGSNALASSIVLACRPRPKGAQLATRRDFLAALRRELPGAVRLLQESDIAPVDMAQSTIGPGIKVFSSYDRVIEADGTTMRVSTALSMINEVLGEILDGEEAELDPESRFALSWYDQHGFDSGSAGDADSVARAKNTSLEGIRESGIGHAHAGKFRLYERDELDTTWSPLKDKRPTVWEATQHLTARLSQSETDASQLLSELGGYGDRAHQLAYLLYQKADAHKWNAEALAYNTLVTAWPSLRDLAAGQASQPKQGSLIADDRKRP